MKKDKLSLSKIVKPRMYYSESHEVLVVLWTRRSTFMKIVSGFRFIMFVYKWWVSTFILPHREVPLLKSIIGAFFTVHLLFLSNDEDLLLLEEHRSRFSDTENRDREHIDD